MKEPPRPAQRRIPLLKQQNGRRTSLLGPHIPFETGHRACEGRFDYSETRLSAKKGPERTLAACGKAKGRPGNRHRKQSRTNESTIKRRRPHRMRSLPAPPQWWNVARPTHLSISLHTNSLCTALAGHQRAHRKNTPLRTPPAPLVHLLALYVHPLHPGCTKVAPFWQLVDKAAAGDTDLVNCAGQRKTAPTRKDIA